jgi:tetratricopeptide (TPR) repeat protein
MDPNLSDGYWLLAEYYWHLTRNDSSIYYAEKAIEIDPNHGLAYQVLGVNYYMIKDFRNALFNLGKAGKILAGDPDQFAQNLNWRGTVYMAIGDYEKTHEIIEESLNYDKVYGYWGLWLLNFTKGEFDKSKTYIDSLCALDSTSCLDALALYYIYSDQIDNLKAGNDKLDLIDHLNNVWKTYVFQKTDQPLEAEKFFNEAYEYLTKTIELQRIDGKGGLNHYDLAAQYAFIGKKKESYYILNLMEEKQNLECWMVWWMDYDPRFESMRDEEEFRAIIQRQEKQYTKIRAQIDQLEKAGVIQLIHFCI